jgi:hypothetical protein
VKKVYPSHQYSRIMVFDEWKVVVKSHQIVGNEEEFVWNDIERGFRVDVDYSTLKRRRIVDDGPSDKSSVRFYK